MRASVSTCFPAANAAQVISQCRLGQVPMQTASICGSAIAARQSGYTLGIPNSWATFWDDAGVRLATPTNSTPLSARNPGI
jgi:hypothetical protein